MKIKSLFLIISLFAFNLLNAQVINKSVCAFPLGIKEIDQSQIKIFTRSYGMIIGLQKGKYTFIELGGEVHWRKILALKPRLWAITANMEYNFNENILGYKLTFFAKRGRINFTYGANAVYYTDFESSKLGLGPAIGFKLLGFHLINGFNIFIGNKEMSGANTLYLTLRYFIPIRSKVRIEKSKKNK